MFSRALKNYYKKNAHSGAIQRRSVRKVACNFIKNESLAQVFSCEFCEISKNTFFYRTPPVADSAHWRFLLF